MPFSILFYLPALVISITIHEFAHAWTADHLGDPTPRLAGRITLNPLAHLDPIGTIAILLFHFGWGKPVVFDPYNLKNPRRDSALIAIAGPASNFILAFFTSLLLHFVPLDLGLLTDFFVVLVYMNVSLAVFNLLPLHPLDGGKIITGFVDAQTARQWDEILEHYGLFILLFLFLPIYNGRSPLDALLTPIVGGIIKIMLG